MKSLLLTKAALFDKKKMTKSNIVKYYDNLKCNLKAEFSTSLLLLITHQFSVSHDPSEIILLC